MRPRLPDVMVDGITRTGVIPTGTFRLGSSSDKKYVLIELGTPPALFALPVLLCEELIMALRAIIDDQS